MTLILLARAVQTIGVFVLVGSWRHTWLCRRSCASMIYLQNSAITLIRGYLLPPWARIAIGAGSSIQALSIRGTTSNIYILVEKGRSVPVEKDQKSVASSPGQ